MSYPDWETVTIRGLRYAVNTCGSCGVVYVVPLVVHQNHFDNGGYAHCSNGHQWGWREGHTDGEAVRRERDRLKQKVAELEDESRAAEKRAQAAEQKLKQTQARIGAGVCPCCNRTFSQLARHAEQAPRSAILPTGRKEGAEMIDGLREHWEPLSVTAPRRRHWRRLCRIIDGVLFVAAVAACVALIGALGVIWG